jgi:hypothetical protein
VPQPKVHVVIVSWQGRGDAARAIATAVAPVADGLSVVYSNAAEQPESGPGHWVQVPNSAYFGPKFEAALAHTPPGAVLLLIHADTTHADWPAVVARCRAAFARYAHLGVWAPEVGDTPYRTEWVSLLPQPGDPALVAVMQTDGIVFALAPAIQQRLRSMDYACNNLGWGIDWAAAAHALCSGHLVLRDTALHVGHTRGSGYDTQAAEAQMRAFLAQLPMPERNMVALLKQHTAARRAASKPVVTLLRRLLRRLCGKPAEDPLVLALGRMPLPGEGVNQATSPPEGLGRNRPVGYHPAASAQHARLIEE